VDEGGSQRGRRRRLPALGGRQGPEGLRVEEGDIDASGAQNCGSGLVGSRIMAPDAERTKPGMEGNGVVALQNTRAARVEINLGMRAP
jgi:hypothetical protein